MFPILGPKDQVQISGSDQEPLKLGGRWSVSCPLSDRVREHLATVWRRGRLIREIMEAYELAFYSDFFPVPAMGISFREHGPWFMFTAFTGGMCVPDYERGYDYVAVNIDNSGEAYLLATMLQQTIYLVLKDLEHPMDEELAPEPTEPLDYKLEKEIKVTYVTVKKKSRKRGVK